ncbi:hypothetical protein [Kitasatospora azatica]|uniref:hypothetical protein n=1 Tax=Kitasatospora azatica TaxID=58347 RepID=UPI0006894B2F|nr:hypothetical protein [Kitasatospora azatica]
MAKQPRKHPAKRTDGWPSRAYPTKVKPADAKPARRTPVARRAVLAGVLGLVLAGGVTAVVAASHGGGAKPGSTAAALPSQPRTTADGRTTSPPWDAPADASAAVAAAGLPMLDAEGTVEHIHAHLDVYLDGKAVSVPPLIGIDETAQRISPLHTHDTSGVIHIESPVKTDFTLGQFMTEWQVSLAADHLGGATTDGSHTLTAYVDGKPVTGDPAAVVLGAHQEIALVYGTATENAQVSVPSSFAFPNGE